jgi:hypothetical protein
MISLAAVGRKEARLRDRRAREGEESCEEDPAEHDWIG